jgi:superfamily I DNA/RNA helicase
MEDALERGVRPERIAFCAFTRAAAAEAKTRACARFGLSDKDLPFFRTLHSLAFRELGLSRSDVVGPEHLQEVSALTGELMTGDASTDGPAAGRNADPMLTVDHYARTTRQPLRAAWADHGGGLEWFRLKRFADAYALYKQERELLDFTDMLTSYATSGLPPVPVDLAVVDEIQDLTLAQHAVAEHAFAECADVYYAGDDDQSIHRWSGAAEDYVYALPFVREVLPLSHRLPSEIFGLAQSVVRRIGRRFAKAQSAARTGGTVEWIGQLEEANLSTGKWLLLARTRAQLEPLAALAREQGGLYTVKGISSLRADHLRAIRAWEALRGGKRVEGADAAYALRAAGIPADRTDDGRTYSAAELGLDPSVIWHDALIRIPLDDREYYLACMRRGEKLQDPPRIRVETIHGAKGAEAESVLLACDMTYRTNRGYELDPDSEMRVLYVGLTRASQRLTLLAPQTAYGYRF